MKKAIFLITIIAVISVVSLNAFSYEIRTIRGEVVELGCYCTTCSKGEEHKSCAAKCMEQGEPSGILEEGTDKLYVIVSAEHDMNPSKKIAPYAAMVVEATGKVNERGGITTIDISDIKRVAK
jgi:hypothetical protein